MMSTLVYGLCRNWFVVVLMFPSLCCAKIGAEFVSNSSKMAARLLPLVQQSMGLFIQKCTKILKSGIMIMLCLSTFFFSTANLLGGVPFSLMMCMWPKSVLLRKYAYIPIFINMKTYASPR